MEEKHLLQTRKEKVEVLAGGRSRRKTESRDEL